KIDLIIELHQTGSSAKFLKFYSLLSGTPYFFHNHHNHQGNLRYSGERVSAIQRDLDGVWSAFSTLDLVNQNQVPCYLDFSPKMTLPSNVAKKKGVVLGVVAGRPTKMWPLEHFYRLCQELYRISPDLEILI